MSTIDILLVEDDPRDLELTLRTLKKNNIANHIFVARDGAEALAFLQSGSAQPRLVLLDLKLPKVSGLEVLTQIRQNPATKDTPVVILTSTDDQPEIDACYRLGANSFVRKPVDFAQFTEAVRQVGVYWLLLNQPPKAGQP
ncbi:MAG: response regulator [Planctomycetes bacterium]|nr:response regulator [Planctomycetota bacterium]